MKRYILSIILIATVACGSSWRDNRLRLAAAKSKSVFSPLDLNPVAWWRGEDDATDSVSTNDGTWGGTETYASGVVGKAFEFNGASYISIGDQNLYTTTNATMAAWVKLDTFFNYAAIIGNGILQGGTYGLGLYASATIFGAQYRGTVVNDVLVDHNDSTAWHHIVIVMRDTAREMWIDGALSGSTALAEHLLPNSRWGIGASYDDPVWEWKFDGLIDEVMVFDNDLTETEIKLIYGWRP